MTGERTQLITTRARVSHATTPSPPAAIPNPAMAPTMECVVLTGRPNQVDRFKKSAAAKMLPHIP